MVASEGKSFRPPLTTPYVPMLAELVLPSRCTPSHLVGKKRCLLYGYFLAVISISFVSTMMTRRGRISGVTLFCAFHLLGAIAKQ